jgi:hypothetical protein
MMLRGEVCTYKVKAVCGAPVFEAIPGGDWSSSIDNFNITWVDFEKESTDSYETRQILS